VCKRISYKRIFGVPSSHTFFFYIPINKWLDMADTAAVLPLPVGFSSFNPLLSHLYEPAGVLSFLGGGIFVIADVLFWIGWINFYVRLFNCLPAIPLDSGYVFREMLNPVLRIGNYYHNRNFCRLCYRFYAGRSLFPLRRA